ncbi:MAG: NnrU family protein [Gemmobacter sp.]|nr:NnrU family protein [Gemmobacter sp.]
MILLILGVALWALAHFFKRLAPERRAAMGDTGRGLVAGLVLLSVVLMVWGYRTAEVTNLWAPPAFLTHLNNLLMILAFYLYAASASKIWIATKIRHPQLTAVKIWAVSHLMVNGDLASIILFGGLLAWAVVSVILINRAQPGWIPPKQAPARKEVTSVVITLIVVGVVMAIHNWLGVQPWG